MYIYTSLCSVSFGMSALLIYYPFLNYSISLDLCDVRVHRFYLRFILSHFQIGRTALFVLFFFRRLLEFLFMKGEKYGIHFHFAFC